MEYMASKMDDQITGAELEREAMVREIEQLKTQLVTEREAAAKDMEDAERYREIARRWRDQKTSESELFLMTLRLDGDTTGCLDTIIDAARGKP